MTLSDIGRDPELRTGLDKLRDMDFSRPSDVTIDEVINKVLVPALTSRGLDEAGEVNCFGKRVDDLIWQINWLRSSFEGSGYGPWRRGKVEGSEPG